MGLEDLARALTEGKQSADVNRLELDNERAEGGNVPQGLSVYTGLRDLSMIACHITSLRDFPRLPDLARLILAENRISGGLDRLAGCPSVEHLNLDNNNIRGYEALEPLATALPRLRHLSVVGTDLSKKDDYRERVFATIPSLVYLDGEDINGDDAPSDEDEEDYEEDEELDDEEWQSSAEDDECDGNEDQGGGEYDDDDEDNEDDDNNENDDEDDDDEDDDDDDDNDDDNEEENDDDNGEEEEFEEPETPDYTSAAFAPGGHAQRIAAGGDEEDDGQDSGDEPAGLGMLLGDDLDDEDDEDVQDFDPSSVNAEEVDNDYADDDEEEDDEGPLAKRPRV